MSSTRRTYTQEYRDSAVALVIDGERTIVDVAKNIGVSAAALGKWVQKTRNERDVEEKPLDINEREELRQLRQQVRELQMQLDFAKKVATWFAKEPR
jgi:transposase